MPQCWHVAPGRSCKCPGQGMGPGTLRYPDTSMAQFPSLRARNGNKQYILAADETIPSFFTMKYIQTYIPGSHEKSNLCIDHMYLCAARFSRRLLNVPRVLSNSLELQNVIYTERLQIPSNSSLGVITLKLCNCIPCLAARIGHEGWGARTSEELSLGSFVCEYAGAMTMRPYQHPSCEDQHPSCEDQHPLVATQIQYFLYV